MTDTATTPRDSFGLPKIDIGPTGDVNQRDHSRAPLISGGTVTGNAFQTSPTDPRITVDSTALIAHATDGTTTFKIDVPTGVVSIISPATGQSGGLQFVDASAAVISKITQDATFGLFIDAASTVFIVSEPTVGGSRAQSAQVLLQGTIASPIANIRAFRTANDSAIMLAQAGNPVSFVFDMTNGGGLDEILFLNGHIITSDQTNERHILNAKAAFTCTFGVRWTAAAAGNGHGASTQYRQVRGSTAGALVTPGAWTLTTVINNTNATGPAIGGIRSESAELTMTATAAGSVIYRVAATAS